MTELHGLQRGDDLGIRRGRLLVGILHGVSQGADGMYGFCGRNSKTRLSNLQRAQINYSDRAGHSTQRPLTELLDLDSVADGCGQPAIGQDLAVSRRPRRAGPQD